MINDMTVRGTARETASLVLQALVSRISEAVSRPGADHPMLRPTVFVPVRRGDVLTNADVVARRV
jgi:hypothetical protein